MKAEDWHYVLNTNLTGAFLCTQQVLQPMMRARWGRIVNITSVVGEMGQRRAGKLLRFEGWFDGLTKESGAGDGRTSITSTLSRPVSFTRT
jgi:3-oxoacyl-[acyl-carrier protein] reductase